MSSLPRKQEIRSISKFGLSQVTVIFDDDTDLYCARQLILERLLEAQRDLPPDVSPELAPISTGLGEIYQFTVEDSHDGKHDYSLMDIPVISIPHGGVDRWHRFAIGYCCELYGEDLDVLQETGQQLAQILGRVCGAADVKAQQTRGLPVLQIQIDRDRVARYGINVSDIQDVVRTAVAGSETTRVLEGTKRFSLVAQLIPAARSDAESLSNIVVTGSSGSHIPLGQLATLTEEQVPSVVSREEGERLTTVETNVRGRDIGSLVAEAQQAVDRELKLPPGYHLQSGGLWEHLESGRNRLVLVVPVTFFVVFLLPFTTFQSLRQGALNRKEQCSLNRPCLTLLSRFGEWTVRKKLPF